MYSEVRRPLEMSLPEELLTLAERFRVGGYELYVVGGAVRDTILGLPPKDFDVATNATPTQVKDLLVPHGYSLLEVGEAFGVVAVVLPYPLEKLEIATFREDLSAGRHPVVRFATIEEDVRRRDLTINALFYDIINKEVVDLVGGLHDLEFGVVRTVGDPNLRFAEDRLRVMRTIRFAARFGWPVGVETERSILFDNNLDGVSPERVRDEFVKSLATAKSVPELLELMDWFEMWPRVLPGLKVSQRRDIESRNVAVVLSQLLEQNDVELVARRLNELRYSDVEVRQTSFLMRFRDLTVDNAFKLRKSYFHSQLTRQEVGQYVLERGSPNPRLALAFADYLDFPPVKGEELLAQGYSGRDLGVELERRETELFRRLG